jgi:hypothetical protein
MNILIQMELNLAKNQLNQSIQFSKNKPDFSGKIFERYRCC